MIRAYMPLPRMIGRYAQLRELNSHLELARLGQGRLLFVAGEAGIGKTRLVHSFTEQAQATPNTEVLVGRCYSEDTAVPYGPFVDAIRRCLRDSGDQVAEIAALGASELVRLLPELDTLLPAPGATGDPLLEKRRLFEAIYRFVKPHIAESCRIIILEDLHWSDRTSQELVQYLARAIERDRVLLVGTYRTDEMHRRHSLPQLIAKLTQERLYHQLPLPPLSRDELARLLDATLARPLPGGFVEALYSHTEGNPFFVEEVLQSLIAGEGMEPLLQSAQQGHRISQLAVPASIRDSILSRAAELDATATEVLRYAAVVGRRFDFELLLALTGLPESELLRAVELLVNSQLVLEERGGPDDRYSFRHALTREAIYDDLLGRERRMKHRAVLRALEQSAGPARDEAEIVGQLAYHSLQARELAKAARYSRLAGARAACLYAYREALAHYESALELMESDDPQERAELLDRLGQAAYPLGETSLCMRYWREAQTLYAQSGDRTKVGDLDRRLGRLCWERGEADAAFAHTRAAITLLEQETPGHELAMAYSSLSQLYMITNQHHESISQGETALALANRLGDVAVKAHALNNIGCSLVELGETERGIAALEQSLLLAKQAELPLDTVRSYLNLGGMLSGIDQAQRAAEVLYEGMSYAQEFGIELYRSSIAVKLASIELELGHWQQAYELTSQANITSEVEPALMCDYIPVQGELLLRQGQPTEARRLLESTIAKWDRMYDPHALQAVLLVLARSCMALGDLDAALAQIERCSEAWQLGKPSPKIRNMLNDGVLIYLRAGRESQGRKLVELIVSLTAGGTRGPQPYADDALGLLAAHEGRHSDAAERFAEASSGWLGLGLPYHEGRARRRRAESLLNVAGPEALATAQQELIAARQIFASLGALSELEAVAAVAVSYELRQPTRPTHPTSDGLTPRERQVLALLAQGLSNRSIAESLVISEKTVETHVSNILGKLNFTSRTQAAAYAVEQGTEKH